MAQLDKTEIELIKNTFKGNEALMIALRKIFYPAFDINAKIGEQIDFWLNVKFDDITPEQALINMKARKHLIEHVEGGLMKLKAISESVEPTEAEIKEKTHKDSSK